MCQLRTGKDAATVIMRKTRTRWHKQGPLWAKSVDFLPSKGKPSKEVQRVRAPSRSPSHKEHLAAANSKPRRSKRKSSVEYGAPKKRSAPGQDSSITNYFAKNSESALPSEADKAEDQHEDGFVTPQETSQ